MKNACVIISLLLLCCFQSYAQQLKVTGNVKDTYGEPLMGVSIIDLKTKQGTISDLDGNFSITVSDGKTTLEFSYMGFEKLNHPINNKSNLSIVMKEDTKALEEVVVVGYGIQKKSDLTGGVVALGKDQLEKIKTPNVLGKLQGQVAGLNVSTGDARPGNDQSLRVRGENSLSAANNPLIILDGIPYSGSIGDIDPEIIESLSVLKDASSTAIYGSRAANGVILIQTKKGAKGTAQISYKGYFGFEEVERRLDVMKGPEYVKYVQDYNHLKFGYTGDELDPMKLLNPSERQNYTNGTETDWQDVMFRDAFTHSHQLSISGGTEKTSYMAAVAYLNQEGVVENTGYDRFNISLNVDQELNKWFKVGMGTQFVQKNTGGIAPYIESGIKQSPYGTLYNENGTYYDYPMDETLFYNPMANVNGINDNTSRNVFLNVYADIKLPIDGLAYRTNFGYNYRSNTQGTYYGRNTLSGKKVNGSASIYNSHYYDWTWENILRYNKEFGKNRIDFTGLFSLQQTDSRSSKLSGEKFVNDDAEYHNIDAAEENKKIESDLKQTSLASYMARINYAYDSKYLATFTARGDGYSAFGKNNKWALFPSAALGWVMSSEEFMSSLTDKWMDMLKLRLSYGANGNQAISPYQTLDRLSLNNYIWGDGGETVNGSYLPFNGVGNPNLRWETTYSLNTGLDFSFWSGRLSGTFEYYRSTTKDLLMSRNVPVMNGFSSIMYNVGKTRNQGIEITLRSVNVETKDFRWGSTFNFARNRDKIIELRGDGKDDMANKWFIGEPLRVFHDYKVIGVWQNDDDFEAVKQPGAVPGSSKLQDTNGDGKISAADKVIIGSKLPSFLASLGNDLTYKNVTLSFLFNGVFGVTKEDPFVNIERWIYRYNYLSGMNYWMPDNPSNEVSSPVYNPYDKHAYYKKVNFVRLQNINLSYRFPKSITERLNVGVLSMYVNVNNAFTISNTKGFNPEASSLATAYPNARSYTFGLNLSF